MPDPIEIVLPLAGGCPCGACRYRVTRTPLTLYVCHCSECQRQSSSGFGMSMPIPGKSLRITSGVPRLFQRPSASGRASDPPTGMVDGPGSTLCLQGMPVGARRLRRRGNPPPRRNRDSAAAASRRRREQPDALGAHTPWGEVPGEAGVHIVGVAGRMAC